MSIFNLFAKCKVSAVSCQNQCVFVDADEVEEPRSVSFLEEEEEDWDDDDDDDDDD